MAAGARASLTLPAAALLGAASVAGFAPLGWFPVPIACITALLVLWHRAASPRDAALTGFAFGLGLFGTGVSWVYISLHDYGMMPWPLAGLATLLFCAYLALHPALVGVLLVRLRTKPWLGLLVAAPALWVLVEWLRLWVFTGFPWLALGYSQLDGPLAGYAALLGAYGVSLVACLLAGLFALAIVERGAMLLAAPLAAAVLIAGGWGLGQVNWTTPVGEPVTVSLLQGNIPQEMKFVEGRYRATLDIYERLARRHPARLIVMPETAIPRLLDSVSHDDLGRFARIALEQRGEMIVGVPARDAAGRYFNAAITLGGTRTQSYAKTHLVPFGEFIPAGFGWIVTVLQIPLSDFSSGGAEQKPLQVAGQQAAVNICYEDAFGEEIIRQLPQATMLVNISNIAWFGNSLAPGQHLDMSRMRAIETGRPMLRATNTGVTAIVGARGEVVSRLPLFEEGALAGTLRGYEGSTPYARTGNYAVLALCAAGLLAAFMRQRRR